MTNALESRYKKEIEILKNKLEVANSKSEEIMRFSEMGTVETTSDFRILNTLGASDEIFSEAGQGFERGHNLIKAVYKITNTTRPVENNRFIAPEDVPTIEESVNKFTHSSSEEKTLRIMGEKSTGELFLLVWKIKRNDKYFSHFFRIIPTNQIVQSIKEKCDYMLEGSKKMMNDAFSIVTDGIIVLDNEFKILHINTQAKSALLANSRTMMQATLEGKQFQDLFPLESADEVKRRLDYVKRVTYSKEATTYITKSLESEIVFKINPYFDESGFIIGTMTVIQERRSGGNMRAGLSRTTPEIENMMLALKKFHANIQTLQETNRVLQNKNEEYENNIKWLTGTNKDNLERISMLYSILDVQPVALSVQSLPSGKYEFVNKYFERFFSLSRDGIRGKVDSEVFDAKYDAYVQGAVDKAIITQSTEELVLGGTKIYISILLNSNGSPTHLIKLYEKK